MSARYRVQLDVASDYAFASLERDDGRETLTLQGEDLRDFLLDLSNEPSSETVTRWFVRRHADIKRTEFAR